MKLGARDTDAFLKQPDKQYRAALIFGPDTGLVRERSQKIVATLLGKDADPLCRVELSSEQLKADPALLRDELCAFSLMGGRRVVRLSGAGEKIAAAIASAFENLESTTYLVVEADELMPSSSLRQLFEKENHFAALACYRDEGRNLEETIRGLLTAQGLRASSDAMHYLVENLGNDRGITAREIEKIALYMGEEKEVTLEIAMELTGQNSSETAEDICHEVASGNVGKAHALLQQLLYEGEQPVSILRSLLRHFQRLDVARAHMQAGTSVDQAVTMLRPPVFFKYLPATKRELNRLDGRRLAQLQNLLLRAEKDLKSTKLAPALLISQVTQQAARLAA